MICDRCQRDAPSLMVDPDWEMEAEPTTDPRWPERPGVVFSCTDCLIILHPDDEPWLRRIDRQLAILHAMSEARAQL